MTVLQIPPTFGAVINKLSFRISRLERIASAMVLKDINTTGLSSAQIDVKVFGSSTGGQASDGLSIVDSTNHLFLIRVAGKWAYTTNTVIP